MLDPVLHALGYRDSFSTHNIVQQVLLQPFFIDNKMELSNNLRK